MAAFQMFFTYSKKKTREYYFLPSHYVEGLAALLNYLAT